MHVPDLLLDESIGVAELQQVRHIGMPEAVQRQILRQAGLVPQLRESSVEITGRQSGAAFRHPQRVKTVSTPPAQLSTAGCGAA